MNSGTPVFSCFSSSVLCFSLKPACLKLMVAALPYFSGKEVSIAFVEPDSPVIEILTDTLMGRCSFF